MPLGISIVAAPRGPISRDLALPGGNNRSITLVQEILEYRRVSLLINGNPGAEEQLIRSFEGEVLRAGRSLDIARSVISSRVARGAQGIGDIRSSPSC